MVATNTSPDPDLKRSEVAKVFKRQMTIRQIVKMTGQIPFSRLLSLSRPEWRSLMIGSCFLLVGSAMGLAYPQAIRFIMDGAFGRGDPSLIDTASAAILVIFLVQAIAIALRAYIFTVAGQRIVMDLRRSLYGRILDQEIAFFDGQRTGELVSRLASDTMVLQNTVSVNVSMALRHSAMVLGGIALLMYTSPLLTGIMLLIVPPIAVGGVTYGRRLRRFSRGVQDALARASEVAEESLSGVRTVRSFTAEKREKERYGVAIEQAFELAKKRSWLSSLFIGIVSFAGYASIALVLWLGGRMVIDGEMTIGDLTSFILYTLIVAFSLGALGGLWADFMGAVGAAERVFELMDREPSIDNDEGQTLASLDGLLSFRNVRFSYPSRPDHRVLHDVTLDMAPGEVVALVGPSGSGKSTMSALVLRLYDPCSGQVRVDDLDIRTLSPDWLRRQIGVVAQEPLLFSTTIAENIRYGRADASDEEIEAAAKAANADDFVGDFPDGYQTHVGERGIQLSGGQKQRIAIARALVKDPRILILDEATSALDAESEHLVKEALERLMVGRTTLVIAHRLSTVKDADRVAVLDSGGIVELGPHDELMRAKGLYCKLVERQLTPAIVEVRA